MRMKVTLTVLVPVSAIQAQQANTQTPEQQHAAMMKRGDAGMGFPHDRTTHHFFLLKNGGVIQVNDYRVGTVYAMLNHLVHTKRYLVLQVFAASSGHLSGPRRLRAANRIRRSQCGHSG